MSSDDATCLLCGHVYRDPLLLPCLHSFCKECLEDNYIDLEAEDVIACPTCNEVSSMPQNGVIAIPQNLLLRQLAEREMLKQRLSTSPECERCTRDSGATSFCGSCRQLMCSDCEDDHKFSRATSSHDVTHTNDMLGFAMPAQCPFPNHSQLKYFCKECKALICSDCMITSHAGHECSNIDDIPVAEESKCSNLHVKCTEAITTLEDAIENGESMIELIGVRRKEADKEINDAFDALEAALVSRRKALLQESNQIATSKTTAINVQLETFRTLQDKMSFASKFYSSATESHRPNELLSVKKTIEDRLESLEKEFEEVFCDLVENDSTYTSLDYSSLKNDIVRFGEISGVDIEPSLCTIQTGVAVSLATVEEAREPFKVSLRNRSGGKVKGNVDVVSSLVKLGEENKRVTKVKSTAPTACVTPRIHLVLWPEKHDHAGLVSIPISSRYFNTVGEYELSVKVRGMHFKNSPYRMWARQKRDFGTILNEEKMVYDVSGYPCGVAVHSGGDVFVTCRNLGYIQVFDNSGTEKRRIGTCGSENGQFKEPWGIVFVGDVMFVADGGNERVQKLTMTGEYLGQASLESRYEWRKCHPMGLSYDGVEHILVVCGEHEIHVLDLDCNLVHKIRCHNSVYDVAVDNDGRIHVAYHYCKVVVLSRDGKYVSRYHAGLSGDEGPSLPRGVAVDENGYRYVTTVSDPNSLEIFNSRGNRVSMTSEFDCPLSIALDNEGYIYVADCNNKRIVKF